MSFDVLFTASNISKQCDLSLRTTKTVAVSLLDGRYLIQVTLS